MEKSRGKAGLGTGEWRRGTGQGREWGGGKEEEATEGKENRKRANEIERNGET